MHTGGRGSRTYKNNNKVSGVRCQVPGKVARIFKRAPGTWNLLRVLQLLCEIAEKISNGSCAGFHNIFASTRKRSQCFWRKGQRLYPLFQRCDLEYGRRATRRHLHMDTCDAHLSFRASRLRPMDARPLRYPLFLHRLHRAAYRLPRDFNDDGSVITLMQGVSTVEGQRLQRVRR